jgi:hypothetical protein
VGDVRNNVKQSPPVVELAFRKEHWVEQPRERRVRLVTLVKGERATVSMSLRSAEVKACDAGAR